MDDAPPGHSDRASRSVRVALPTPFALDDLFEYLVRPDVVFRWLGHTSALPTQGRASLPRGTDADPESHRDGTVVRAQSTETTRRITVAWDGEPDATVTIGVSRTPTGSRVRISERGIATDEDADAALRSWQNALNRLSGALRDAEYLHRRTRQALIVVHGIGEQRPSQALREFTSAIFPDSGGRERFVKPDYVSPLFDLRTVTVRGDRRAGRPTTDVYELYWAHLVRDTTAAQVYGWGFRLLFARNRNIPRPLKVPVWGIRILLFLVIPIVVVLVVTGTWSWLAGLLTTGVLVLVPAIFWFVFGFLRDTYIVNFAGDAARYLEPRTENIRLRQEIREAGLELFDALHDGGRYDRVIVYGHSLGSVIAYDILSHAWTQRSREHDSTLRRSSRRMFEVEDLLNPRPGDPEPTIDEIQRRQHAAWEEYRRNGFTWLVTDFVTAGSPLTHARWLLNLDKKTSFDTLVADRVFPTCPPAVESIQTASSKWKRQTFTFTHSYPDLLPNRTRSVQVPHHAGLFAMTRWTNLYFPASWVIHGDPVGGPLHGTFGQWIRDLPVPHPGGMWFAHSKYLETKRTTAHVDLLKGALALPFSSKVDDLILREPARDAEAAANANAEAEEGP